MAKKPRHRQSAALVDKRPSDASQPADDNLCMVGTALNGNRQQRRQATRRLRKRGWRL